MKRSRIIKGMRIVLALLLGVLTGLVCVNYSNAADVKLGWDKNSEPDVIGYKLRYGVESGKYEAMIDVPSDTLEDGANPTYTVKNLSDGIFYYFVATAYDVGGRESLYSNEVISDDGIKPTPPKGVCFVSITSGE